MVWKYRFGKENIYIYIYIYIYISYKLMIFESDKKKIRKNVVSEKVDHYGVRDLISKLSLR